MENEKCQVKKTNRLEYFLNAVHYCLWIGSIKFGDSIKSVADKIVFAMLSSLFTNRFKARFYERKHRKQAEANRFFYDEETGFHIGYAGSMFGFMYTCYFFCLSFIISASVLKAYGKLNGIADFILFAAPMVIGYIPAYKAVFAKRRYMTYFKQFKQKDERWRRKWKYITLMFCVGSCLAFAGGIYVAIVIGELQ